MSTSQQYPQQQYPQQQYPQQQYPQQQVFLPTIASTLLITLFFGLFGLIPAITHTTRARDAGQPTNKYWITFACTTAFNVVFWIIVFGSVMASAPTYYYYGG